MLKYLSSLTGTVWTCRFDCIVVPFLGKRRKYVAVRDKLKLRDFNSACKSSRVFTDLNISDLLLYKKSNCL